MVLYTQQKRRSPAFILSVAGVEGKAYRQDPTLIRDHVEACPFCGHKLAKNGCYRRNIPVGASYTEGVILRAYCSACKVAFSLIPAFILPWHSYGRALIVAWLLERLQGSVYRSQRFLVEHSIEHTLADASTSWTDMLDCERTCPGYQRFQGWTRRFSLAAQAALGSFLAALAWVDLDLQSAVVRVASLQPPDSSTSPLALALACSSSFARPRAPTAVDPAAELGRLVGMLMMRPLPVSHKIRRAFSDRIQYDTLVI